MGKVETKKDEIRYTTSEPKEMLYKYLAKRVLKTYTEDFADEETGEVVSVERNQILFQAGIYIDSDILSEIMFFLQSGDITEVEVTNQKREAYLSFYDGLAPYMVQALIAGKQQKLLLYASSVLMAHAVVNDYIELNYSGVFYILQIKEFNHCTIIEESPFKKLVDTPFGIKSFEENETEDIDKKYYQIKVNITINEEREIPQTFVLKAKDAENAKELINIWLRQAFDKEALEESKPLPDFTTTIDSATIFPCHCAIDKNFSLAYINE